MRVAKSIGRRCRNDAYTAKWCWRCWPLKHCLSQVYTASDLACATSGILSKSHVKSIALTGVKWWTP